MTCAAPPRGAAVIWGDRYGGPSPLGGTEGRSPRLSGLCGRTGRWHGVLVLLLLAALAWCQAWPCQSMPRLTRLGAHLAVLLSRL